MMITVLAHGALGYWDEAILFAIVAIFLGFTVMSWIKNREAPTDLEQSSLDSQSTTSTTQLNKNPDKNHFELD